MANSQIEVAFISTIDDPHSERFSRIFEESDYSYLRVFVEIDEHLNAIATIGEQVLSGWPAIVQFLEDCVSLVVSGPLDSCSSKLSEGRFRHLGISWATDIMGRNSGGLESLTSLQSTARALDGIVTDNFASENALIAVGADPKKIARFPWGPTVSGQNRPPQRVARGLPNDRTLILQARTLEPHYQPGLFVEAINRLRGAHPGLAGVMIEKGSQVTAVKNLIADHGLEGSFFWQAAESPSDFPETLRIFDAVVMSPITDGTSVTLLDAMQRRIPVICSLTNGSSEWIVDGVSGWTFPTGDADGLAIALDTFLQSDPKLVQRITDNAHRLVNHRADWEHSERQLRNLVGRLLANI